MTNVLIYIVDALRADHLSCYGYGRPTTPNFDALAAEPSAVRFSAACSPSTWTKPVAASILSGCYPPAHGVRSRSDLFVRAVPRLPELLQGAGYRTAAVSTIGNVSSPMGFAVGFDTFVDLYKDPSLVSRREVSNTGAWKLYFEEDTTVVLPLAEDVNDAAAPWLAEQATASTNGTQPAAPARPWFLFLWVLDPHDPYYPPPGYDRWRDPAYTGKIDGSAESVRRVRTPADVQQLVDLYDGEIAYTDEQFGLLVRQLKAQGQYDDTLIVVAGDHGEAFGEHGDFVHGHLAYEEIMRVPLIVKFPAGFDVQADSTGALAQLTDIAPTVLDALGLDRLAEGMQGVSLLPAVRSGEEPRALVYSETQASTANQRLLALRDGRWKYLRVDPPGDYSGRSAAGGSGTGKRLAGYLQQLANPEMMKRVLRNPMFYVRRQRVDRDMLFDLQADPAEQHNIAAENPQIVQRMAAALDAWLAECSSFAALSDTGAQLGLDEETLRQLEGLGYL
ncbi:MAG: sulfatase [Anaerolineae bacterium]|nr:sulfatase [Anaerolineae bacterium]